MLLNFELKSMPDDISLKKLMPPPGPPAYVFIYLLLLTDSEPIQDRTNTCL